MPLKPTEPEFFFNRREFCRAAAASVMGSAGFSSALACQPTIPVTSDRRKILEAPIQRPEVFPARRNEAFAVPSSVPDRPTERLVAATHNNFYEFLPGYAGEVWKHTSAFRVDPWKVEVTGECHEPRSFDLDDLFRFEHEERVYHFRCVERWAMTVPWSGFPLRKLLEKVKPKSNARYVKFLTAYRPKEMPGIAQASSYDWPYFEGLRIDEATHDLTLAVTGVYGEALLKQHGAPLRIAVPWKYGYKNPKSIVKIELVEKEPSTFWQIQPHEYGFLSNVNPNVPHPRWSQARSHWIDTKETFPTPMFNGYADQVASLYPDEPTTPQEPLKPGQKAR